ncbi:MAG: pyridoxal phosphate-dependent aminotransferase [Propionibacteriaceae bacterium]|nr:pyridoxal phosphate-dependent aminotransferase [Propionibacteriaceae bacterium]
MTYDFDTILDRRETNSLKWDVAEGELPMWVADMDFRAATEITEAVVKRAATGVFGYSIVPAEFRRAVSRWWTTRYDWAVDPAWVDFCDGVVPAISSLVRTLTAPGEGVVVQSPVYNCFYSSIRNSGRTVLVNDLLYIDGRFRIDWPDLEAKLADPKARVLLLCNPQNPTGDLWTSAELADLGALAAANDVVVIADEIHCDITEPGVRYQPFAAVDAVCEQNSITLVSPTKAFNIPGLQTSAVIAANPELRERAIAGLNRDEIAEPNVFAVEAAVTAYTVGVEWLDEMRHYVWRNRARLEQFVAEQIPDLHVIPSQATYLAWIDCGGLGEDSQDFCAFLRQETGLVLSAGEIFGDNAHTFVRMNLACPATMLDDGLDRLYRGVAAWKKR